jgi:hypothetical protein
MKNRFKTYCPIPRQRGLIVPVRTLFCEGIFILQHFAPIYPLANKNKNLYKGGHFSISMCCGN